jgi:hypothetical protein
MRDRIITATERIINTSKWNVNSISVYTLRKKSNCIFLYFVGEFEQKIAVFMDENMSKS